MSVGGQDDNWMRACKFISNTGLIPSNPTTVANPLSYPPHTRPLHYSIPLPAGHDRGIEVGDVQWLIAGH